MLHGSAALHASAQPRENNASLTPTRRILVESARHHQRPPRIGVTPRNRQQHQPAHGAQIAWRAQRRLYGLGRRLRERRKPANLATAAVARELACFLWAVAVAP